jgi:hypothetical protein
MTVATKREKLQNLINTADDEKIEAIFSKMEDEIEEKYDHWEDDEFVAEMKNRIDDYENGVDKGLSWEEVKLMARNEFKANH